MIDEMALYAFAALLLIAPLATDLIARGRRRWRRLLRRPLAI